MLDVGATTFWEDFNMEWLPDAGRIDELVPAGKKDIHGDYGAYLLSRFSAIACAMDGLRAHIVVKRVRIGCTSGGTGLPYGTYHPTSGRSRMGGRYVPPRLMG